jgi:hypothetical protein
MLCLDIGSDWQFTLSDDAVNARHIGMKQGVHKAPVNLGFDFAVNYLPRANFPPRAAIGPTLFQCAMLKRELAQSAARPVHEKFEEVPEVPIQRYCPDSGQARGRWRWKSDQRKPVEYL